MTQYNGERFTICHTAAEENGVALTDADVVAVYVTVYNRDYTVLLVAETTMTWRATTARWEYDWITTAVAAGTYRARVRILGADGQSVWEYQRLKITADPVPV